MFGMRIAAAPVSWGVFDGTESVPASRMLDEMVQAGYAGTELGPPGYFDQAPALRADLRDRQLDLVASFLPLALSDEEKYDFNARAASAVLDTLEAAAPYDTLPLLLLSDAYQDPGRIAAAGRIEQHPEFWLSDGAWRVMHEQINTIAGASRERGFGVAFHPHAGSYVETPREIERLMTGLDTNLVGLCLDTGHVFFGGGDPLTILRDHGSTLTLVHLKDVDLEVLAQLKGEDFGLDEAWRRDVFCELGRGGVDLDAMLDAIRRLEYSGWIVVEQDRILEPDDSPDVALNSARTNREFLRLRGY